MIITVGVSKDLSVSLKVYLVDVIDEIYEIMNIKRLDNYVMIGINQNLMDNFGHVIAIEVNLTVFNRLLCIINKIAKPVNMEIIYSIF